MKINIKDTTDYLDELVNYLAANLNGTVVKHDEDSYYKEHTLVFDYDYISDSGVVCKIIYVYPNGNKRYEMFHIIANEDGEFQIDSTNNPSSSYNIKYHIAWFSNKEEVLQYIKGVEDID